MKIVEEPSKKMSFSTVTMLLAFLSLSDLQHRVDAQTRVQDEPTVAEESSVVVSDSTPLDHKAIERIVQQGIAEGQMPGAVVVIASRNRILYQRAFGDRSMEPTRQPMTLDTVFDLASLTKPLVTATSVMRLVQAGKIEIDQPVCNDLPEFGTHGKQFITVSDLLLHTGGLTPDNALADYQDGPGKAWERICALKPISGRGERFAYSDVGFIVLGMLVQRVSGKSLDQFVVEEVFHPLGMDQTMYNPTESMKQRAAPTEKRDGRWLVGHVHDPRAHQLGGVAGHAGLFSTAEDLVKYGQMMLGQGRLGQGRLGKVTILEKDTFLQMTQPRKVPRGTRTLGWDHRSPYSIHRGDCLSDAAFGHGGFTGTVLWIDPEQDRVFLFLSNRLHPDGQGSINRLAGKIASLIHP